MRFAGGKSNTPAMNDSVSARDTGLDRLPPQPIVCSANRALDKRPYGGGGERCSPLRREGPGFVIARAGTARGNPSPPSPFFHVFKWQFENTTILNSQFSISNSPGRAAMAVNDRRYGGYERGVGDAAPYGGGCRFCL